MRTARKTLTALAATTAAALTLAACGGDTDADADDTIVIGVFHGWEEGIATSHLWYRILTDEGYDVELEYGDVGPVFVGLADGDYHLNFDTALPHNHAPYMEEYGDNLESLGVWYPEYPNTIVVNDDAPITA